MKLEDVLAARARIRPHIHKTPLLRCRQMEQRLGCELWLKAECLQKTGAFKARGVLNFLMQEPDERELFTTFSSGNHGQAMAWAAGLLGKRAHVFMPEDASPVKTAAVRDYGGQASFAGRSSEDRRAACSAFADSAGAVIVPPYDHDRIIAGQGTAMLEVLEELPLFDAALLPVGGGGLMSGNAFVAKTLRPKVELYACEPELASDAKASLAAGELRRIEYPATIADGARNLCMGERNWAIIRERVTAGLSCSEARIREAMAMYAVFMKLYVEPTGAVSLACLMEARRRFAGKRVVVYISGGNIAPADYAKLVSGYASDLG